MEIIINGKVSADPRDRILAIEAVTQAICQQTGQDVAEGVMMLLTAAVHLTNKHSTSSVQDNGILLAKCLGSAIVAADDFFTLRRAALSQEGE